MKSLLALGFIAMSSSLAAGCASTSSTQFAGSSPVRGGNGGISSGMASIVARGADERIGGAMINRGTDSDMHVNEAASFSSHDERFAGPTPQVPIPHDGRQGQPTNW